MRFRYPGLSVALVTSFWILTIPLGIWVAFSLGYLPWYIIAAIVTGQCAMGIWFQIRSAGYVFGGINILLSIVGLVVLFLEGFSLWLCLRIAATTYTAIISMAWAQRCQLRQEIPIYSPRHSDLKIKGHIEKKSPLVAAGKRGVILGASIGLVLGVVTDVILVNYFLQTPPDPMFPGIDSELAILVIFGIGPALLGAIACSSGFVLGAALKCFFRQNKNDIQNV